MNPNNPMGYTDSDFSHASEKDPTLTKQPADTAKAEVKTAKVSISEDDVAYGKEKAIAIKGDNGINIDSVIEEYRKYRDSNTENRGNGNIDKIRLSIPLSKVDNIYDYSERIISHAAQEGVGSFTKQVDNYTSEYQSARSSIDYFGSGNNDGKAALAKTNPAHLVSEIDGIREGTAGVSSKHIEEGRSHKLFSGAEAYRVFATIGSGVRKVILWNSGITLTLKNIPLRLLDQYIEETVHDDYEYGKEYGGWYYLFASLLLDKNIVEKILPAAIIGSNYKDWSDTDKLMRQISLQDYPVIVWTLACLMYPAGTTVNYICGEPNCGHIHSEKIDLGKLKRLNRDLINDKMIDYFKVNQKKYVGDEDIENYLKIANFDDSFTCDVSDTEGEIRRYKFNLKQCTIADHLAVGDAFNKDLNKAVSKTDRDAVMRYITFNQNRCYRPWIKSVECAYIVNGETTSTFVVENDPNGDNNETFDLILDEMQQRVPEFATKLQDYIRKTKITHIAFYFQECPKCHTKPETSFEGYVPYDPVQAFFTLGRMKLWRISSQQSEQARLQNTSTNTSNS